jgi:hypothetical protein
MLNQRSEGIEERKAPATGRVDQSSNYTIVASAAADSSNAYSEDEEIVLIGYRTPETATALRGEHPQPYDVATLMRLLLDGETEDGVDAVAEAAPAATTGEKSVNFEYHVENCYKHDIEEAMNKCFAIVFLILMPLFLLWWPGRIIAGALIGLICCVVHTSPRLDLPAYGAQVGRTTVSRSCVRHVQPNYEIVVPQSGTKQPGYVLEFPFEDIVSAKVTPVKDSMCMVTLGLASDGEEDDGTKYITSGFYKFQEEAAYGPGANRLQFNFRAMKEPILFKKLVMAMKDKVAQQQ